MIKVYFLLIIIIAFFWFKVYLNKEPSEQKSYVRKSTLYGLIFIFILLVAMGRLNWVFAALGIGGAFISRFFTMALRYAPQLQRLWFEFRRHGSTQQGNSRVYQKNEGAVTVDEAYKILGVSEMATRQEIIDAHRQLMSKNHPDRGGSTYLAAQINKAKEVLLKS